MPLALGKRRLKIASLEARFERTCFRLVLVCLVVFQAGPSPADERPRARTFVLTYRATVRDLPKRTKVVELWLPLPQTDRNQTIHQLTIESPSPVSIGREPRSGNQCLHFRVDAPRTPIAVFVVIQATRRESAGANEPLSDEDRARYLAAEPLVPVDGAVRTLAFESTRGLTTEADKARAIYDKVTGMMKYDKTGTGWGRGDALFACSAKRGNCTDFHALIIGMCRSAGIPARFAIGLPLPATRGEAEVAGYHCWAELCIQGGGWAPVDASEAAKDPSRRDYFFGHHDENRLEFSRDRHLTLAPSQHGPPLNFFIHPYAEVDGRPYTTIESKITFIDKDRPATGVDAPPEPAAAP